MRKELQVKQDGKIIYRMDFPVDQPWQFGEFAKLGLDDFRRQFPDVSLYAPNVTFVFAESE